MNGRSLAFTVADGGVAARRTVFLAAVPIAAIADRAHAAQVAVAMHVRKRPAASIDPSVDGGYL